MFDKFIAWRKEHDVDNVCKRNSDNVKKIWEYYPTGYYGTTKEGYPIYIERYGNLKLKKIFELCSHEELVDSYIASYERFMHIILPACSKAAGKFIGRSFSILDCKGLGITQCMKKKNINFLKIGMSIAADYYPETMYKCFIVNTSMLFSGLYKMIGLFIDKKTKAKMKVKSSGFKKLLLEFV